MSAGSADSWTKTQTIASLIALIAIILAIIGLINERIQRVRGRDAGSVAADPSKMEYFFVPQLSRWSAFNGGKTEDLKMTTIQGLIKAGDSQLWTSAALDQLPEIITEICWVALYKSIFDEVAIRLSTGNDREDFPKIVRKFLSRADDRFVRDTKLLEEIRDCERKEQQLGDDGKDSIKLKKTRKKLKKMRKKRSYFVDRNEYYKSPCPDLINCCRKFKVTDPNGETEDEDLGLQDIQPTWLVGDRPCIATSREELAGLALILGMRLKWHAYAPSLVGVGAFATSLRAGQENGTWRLHLMQATRIPRHFRSPGSGYTTLMAKHIACGSLPFADTSRWVRSVFVTDKVIEGIRTGGSVKDVQSFGGEALEYLRRLPGVKQIDAFYDIDPTPRPDASLGTILKSNGSPLLNTCTWSRAVTGIAFGGLVPQAAEYLAQAVAFTVAGIQGKCFEELESLINELHRHNTDKEIFGAYVSERIRGEDLVDNVNYTLPTRSSDVRDAAAVFARYMTLIERVTARCEVKKDPVDAVFEAACRLIQRAYVSAVRKDEASTAERAVDLGLTVKRVKDEISRDKAIPLDDCAVVVRAVIAAWAWQVPYIAWPANASIDSNSFTLLDDIPPLSALA